MNRHGGGNEHHIYSHHHRERLFDERLVESTVSETLVNILKSDSGRDRPRMETEGLSVDRSKRVLLMEQSEEEKS